MFIAVTNSARAADAAAIASLVAGPAIELCEGLRLVSGQAAMQVLPGVLAVAERGGHPGREILAALVLGYEAAARLAAGFKPRPLAHQNGQVSLLAAAAAGARVNGFDATSTERHLASPISGSPRIPEPSSVAVAAPTRRGGSKAVALDPRSER